MATRIWTGATNSVLTTAGNWSGGTAPVAGDNVIFRPGTTNYPTSALTGLNNTALTGALAAVIFETGWTYGIGDSTTALQFSCTRLDVDSSGLLYIDIEASNIGPQVFGTAAANIGSAGLYLIGSNIATLTVQGGTVMVGHAASTVAEARCQGTTAKLYLGNLLTLTTAYAMDGGTIVQRCASTTSKARDGNLTTEEAGAITTSTLYGKSNGVFTSSGTITTLNIEDADCYADFLGSAEARTITNLNWKRGRLRYDPAVMTITTPAYGLTGRMFDGKLS